MSSIKVKIAVTDASYFISSPNNDLPTNFQYGPQTTSFEWGGQGYNIENYRVDPQGLDLQNWNSAIEAAYRFIALYPNETGYPDLGTEASFDGEFAVYLAIDGSKSMESVVSTLGLSDTAIADFSLIYSWSETAASLSEPEYKDFVAELQTIQKFATDEADAAVAACAAAVAGGNSYTWNAVVDPNGVYSLPAKVCSTDECCTAYKPVYQLALLQTLGVEIFASVGISADTISKKHIYKFLQSGGQN
jgi:hypothetical protein